MSMKSSLEELTQRNAAAANGDEKKVAEQAKAGKQTARQRIAAVLDAGSFVEVSKLSQSVANVPGYAAVSAVGEGVVTGFGTIDERPVYVYAQDYTVLNGSMSKAHAEKIVKIMDMAQKNGAPVIGFLDCGGARIEEGAAAMEAFGMIAKKLSILSGLIPTICVVAGPVVGGLAYVASLHDFTVTVKGVASMLLYGPQIDEDAQTIGSAESQAAVTATAQFLAENEADAAVCVKSLLSYLPANNLEEPPALLCEDDLNRMLPQFEGESPVDTKEMIAGIADNGIVLEYAAEYAQNIITAFARINGYVVGVVANSNGAALDAKAARKAARFVSLMDAYNIPVITLAASEDMPASQLADQHCVIKGIATLISAYTQASVPMITVYVGNVASTGLAAMCSKALGADMVYAWANAVISAMPVHAGALTLYKDMPQSEALEKYVTEYASAFAAAKQGLVDDVIAPSATRQMIAAALEACVMKRETPMPKKHCILPL